MRKIIQNGEEKKYVKYPGHEEMYILVGAGSAPFQNAVVGITYPFPDYRIVRSAQSKTTVFEYVLEGEGDIYANGEQHHVTAGQAYLLRAHEAHSYHASKEAPWKKLWINYTAEYISPYLDAMGLATGVYACPEAKKYFERASLAASSDAPQEEVCREVSEAVHALIFALGGAHRAKKTEEDGERIRRALDSAVYTKLSLDELSRQLHISKSNIIRIFKKSFGTTPYEYLLGEKIEAAKLLLTSTRLSVGEIAERLCIFDAHYFSTLFCARVGVRPRDYRIDPR